MESDEIGGFFVIQRLSDGSTWDGEKWVVGWGNGLHYPPAPADGPTRASLERDRLIAEGTGCYVLYISFHKPRKWVRRGPLMEGSGVLVVQRLGDGKFWNGSDWVVGWKEALHYPPAPADGITRASSERDRLKATGVRCFVLYIGFQKSKKASRRDTVEGADRRREPH